MTIRSYRELDYHIFALALFAPLIYAAPTSTHLTRSDTSSLADLITIRRNVAIIGGGSSGTHAAITLKDKGHTFVVVETKDRMGGHTEAYIDPASGQTGRLRHRGLSQRRLREGVFCTLQHLD